MRQRECRKQLRYLRYIMGCTGVEIIIQELNLTYEAQMRRLKPIEIIILLSTKDRKIYFSQDFLAI